RGGQALVAVGAERAGEHAAGVDHAGDGVARLGEEAAQHAGQVGEATGADLDAGRGRDDVLEHVGLVDDDDVVLGEDRPAAGEVEAVEVEVDHHDVGLGRPGPGRLGEAPVAPRAPGRAGAVAGGGADRGPGRLAGLDLELGPVAGAGGRRPRGDGGELLRVGSLGEAVEAELVAGAGTTSRAPGRRHRRAVGAVVAGGGLQLGEPLDAHVVGPAL